MKKQNLQLKKPVILVIEDDRTMLLTLEAMIEEADFDVIISKTIKNAKEIILQRHDEIEVIFLDRMLPDGDGFELLDWLVKLDRLDPPRVIMETGYDKPVHIKEGLDAGVFYYVTKPLQLDIVKSVMQSAVKSIRSKRILRSELNRHKASFGLMQQSSFLFRSLNEAEDLACFLANCYPDPERFLPIISELFINAIEHGNLEISYEEKTQLIKESKWREEILLRSCLPENAKKSVVVVFKKIDHYIELYVTDRGKGFNWKKYLDIDPARSVDNHGRGIARAKMIFTELLFNKEGNSVKAVFNTKDTKEIDW